MKYFLSLILILISTHSFSQNELRFEVNSGNHERLNTPLSIEVNHFSETELSELNLLEVTGYLNREIPLQVDPEYSTKLWFTLQGTTPQNTKRSFTLTRKGEKVIHPVIEIEKDDAGIKLKSGNKYILQYNHREVLPPEGIDPIFRRSAFIHPVWSPDQQVLTRIQPPDHYHHYGIWNPWTRTQFQGRQVDFWNLGEGQGTVRFKGYISFTEGPVFSGFRVHQEHIDFTSGHDELVAINELLDVRAWNIQTEKKVWLVDFTSILNCATDSSILFFEYRYGGGIGYRATELWGKDNSSVLTSEGKIRDEADASRARWCIIRGESQSTEGSSGILFMSNHQNREHPEPMRMWPSEDQDGEGNVFFMFTPIRLKEWMLNPGKNYVLKYRLLIFDGSLSAQEAEQYWNDFADPPEIKIINN
jgi:hypothetical protein